MINLQLKNKHKIKYSSVFSPALHYLHLMQPNEEKPGKLVGICKVLIL